MDRRAPREDLAARGHLLHIVVAVAVDVEIIGVDAGEVRAWPCCAATICWVPLRIGSRSITITSFDEKAPSPGRAVNRPISIGSASFALVSTPLPLA